MTAIDAEAIYALLPATVKIRDKQSGGTLRDLIGVIAGQAAVVDDNLAQLYDDLFIQTCAPWVIPYIGDLIGYRAVRPIPPNDATTRVDVADTIGFRRRKGTLTVLDQLATDVTGWPSVAVEFFQRLAVSQYVRNHVRIGNTCVNVHSWQNAADFNSAFDTMPRTADVRRIASGRGRYNIPHIGIFVWRLMPFGGATGLTQAAPAATAAMSTAARVGPNRFTFDPFGNDVPLVNPPQPAQARFQLTGRPNVPFALRRFALFLELEALRALAAHAIDSAAVQFFGSPPVLVVLEADGTPIDHTRICVCDLEDWTSPTDPAIRVAVDPELGRLMFRGRPPDPVRVAYCYAFSGQYGGGTYPRPLDPGEADGTIVPSFADAHPDTWQDGVFELADSSTFVGDINLSPQGAVLIRAADFVRPIVLGKITIDATPGGSVTLRGIGIRDGIVIRGVAGGSSSRSSSSATSASSTPGTSSSSRASADSASGGSTSSTTSASSGIVESSSSTTSASTGVPVASSSAVSGDGAHSGSSSSLASASSRSAASRAPDRRLVAIPETGTGPATNLDSAFTVILEHCSLRGPLVWSYDGGGTLTISRSLCATLALDHRVVLSVTESALDGGSDTAAAIAGADGISQCGEIALSSCTVIGTTNARETSLIEDSLLTGLAHFDRTQAGCVRYSFVPPGSTTPRRFRCQPDLAVDAATTAATIGGVIPGATEQQRIRKDVTARVVPAFVSRAVAAPAYLQLSDFGPIEIATGAESGDEMGLFRGLYNGRRESNLRYRLNEYLRIGLEAGVVHAT
ncbi:MAG TPA: hypothetical protein VGC09_11060 [Rhodopila sp.]